jgi:hypothetical protein
MKRTTNYTCSNISTEVYTGKESSPKGLGFSAVPYEIGFEKQGADGLIWVVQMKNGKKVWFRKNGMYIKITHEEPLIQEETINQNQIITQSQIENNSDEIETINDNETKSKKTNYNIFCSYYTNKLKAENKLNGMKKTNMEIRNEAINEWKRLKTNKKEMDELMSIIINKK